MASVPLRFVPSFHVRLLQHRAVVPSEKLWICSQSEVGTIPYPPRLLLEPFADFETNSCRPDYPELGPHAALNEISDPDRILMRDKCFGHAEEIVRILSEFVHHKEEQHLLEHDAAICTYHAARLVLFGTQDDSHESGYRTRTALDKAQLCLGVIKRYFSFSAQLESMVSNIVFLHDICQQRPEKSSRDSDRATQNTLEARRFCRDDFERS